MEEEDEEVLTVPAGGIPGLPFKPLKEKNTLKDGVSDSLIPQGHKKGNPGLSLNFFKRFSFCE